MDWLRDEVNFVTKCNLMTTHSKSFPFTSGSFSFRFHLIGSATMRYSNLPESVLWDVTMEVSLVIKSEEGEDLSKSYSFNLCHKNQTNVTSLWEEETLKPYCDGNGELTVQLSLRVVESHGLRGSFTESSMERIKKSFDGVLEVEDKQISVNKAFLSFESPFFDVLFNANFKEKQNNVFVLKDVKYAEFVCLLCVLCGFQSVNSSSYMFLLELSDKYQCPRVFKLCEDYIVENIEVDYLSHRLKFLALADKYTLPRVQSIAIASITTMGEVKDLSASSQFQQLSDKSQAFVLNTCLAKCRS